MGFDQVVCGPFYLSDECSLSSQMAQHCGHGATHCSAVVAVLCLRRKLQILRKRFIESGKNRRMLVIKGVLPTQCALLGCQGNA